MKKIINELFLFVIQLIAFPVLWIFILVVLIVWVIALLFTLPVPFTGVSVWVNSKFRKITSPPVQEGMIESALSPEDTVEWAKLTAESDKHFYEHFDEIHEAGMRSEVQKFQRQGRYERKETNEAKIILLGEDRSKANEAFRPPALPEADGEESSHQDDT